MACCTTATNSRKANAGNSPSPVDHDRVERPAAGAVIATLTSGGSHYRADLDPPPTHSTGPVHVPVLLAVTCLVRGLGAQHDDAVARLGGQGRQPINVFGRNESDWGVLTG